MSGNNFQERNITGASIAKLTSLLRLPRDPFMQDWAVQCADAQRVEEFLQLYEQGGDLTEDDRFALMALIVASFDDWLWDQPGENRLSPRLRQHLASGFHLHQTTVHYWSLLDEPDPANAFQVTPLMREIWQQAR
ncbi:MAG: hypothetical protein K0Q55_2648 [Verrucomicrobia bacterium]|nr:hypothetical protein [Verrucomicrobiota bacterium]